MKVTSPAFANQQPIPLKYTKDGDNLSPPLVFREVPAEAQSLVLIVEDPDAGEEPWEHWLVWNLNPTIVQLEEGNLPEGALQGLNSFGSANYGGPCPPEGTHHYFFKVYALDSQLDLPESTRKPELLKAMAGHVLEEAELVGVYHR